MTRLGSLYTKVLAGMSGLILLVGLVLVIIVETTVKGHLYEALEKRGAFIAREIASEAAVPLLTDRQVALEMRFRDLMEMDRDIVYLFVQGRQGEVLVHSFGRDFPSDLRGLGTPPRGELLRVERLDTGQGLVLDFSAPVMQGMIGTIHVGVSEAPLHHEVNGLLKQLLLVVLLVLLAGNGIAVVIARTIARPVLALVQATREVAGGNLNAHIDVRGTDEIGVLAASFRDMLVRRREVVSALEVSEKRLRDIAASLGEGVLVIDGGGRLTFMNPEAERLLGWPADELVGADLHERTHARRADGSLHAKEECPSNEVLRTGVRQVVERDVFQRRDGALLPVSYVTAPIWEGERIVAAVIAFQDITMRQQIEEERERLIGELTDALENVKTLSGLIPICASCKSIRDDQGYWNKIEAYMQKHTDAEFSHALCPDCAARLYPQYFKKEGT